MKKAAIIILSFFFAAACYAHPPTKITIAFQPETKTIIATITHPVEDVAKHFIDKVDVAVNGREILEHKISRQDNETDQVVTYRIPDVNPGDTVEIEGYCNISGKLSEKIKVK